MPILDPAAVKSGKVVPKPGDYVNGYAYVSGDPRKNESYKPLDGEDFLKAIAPSRANAARAVLTGRAPYPSLSRMNPANQLLRDDVLAAEPTFDAVAYDTRKKFIQNMTSGNLATLMRALNQAPQHMLSLAGAYDKLNNSNVPQRMNDLMTRIEAGMGNINNQAGARGQFNAAQQPVSEELNTVFTGKAATVAGAEGQKAVFPMGAGPAESNAALGTTAELLLDRLNTIDTQIDNGLGRSRHMFNTINPQARQAIYALYSRTHPGWKPPAAPANVPTPAWQGTGIAQPAPAVAPAKPMPTPQSLPRKSTPQKVGRFLVEPVQ